MSESVTPTQFGELVDRYREWHIGREEMIFFQQEDQGGLHRGGGNTWTCETAS